MMEPQTSVDVRDGSVRIFQIGDYSGNGALLARLFDLVVRTVPQTTTFTHDILDHHVWDVVRPIAERN